LFTPTGISYGVTGSIGYTTFTQTQYGFSLNVQNSTGGGSATVTIDSNGIRFGVGGANSVIDFTGMVTFTKLEDSNSTTTINGAYIETGEIVASKISSTDITGGTITGSVFNSVINGASTTGDINFYYGDPAIGRLCGQLRMYYDNSTITLGGSPYGVILEAFTVPGHAFALKLRTQGDMSIETKGNDRTIYIMSPHSIHITAPEIRLNNTGGASPASVFINGTQLPY